MEDDTASKTGETGEEVLGRGREAIRKEWGNIPGDCEWYDLYHHNGSREHQSYLGH
jgi:hypothetical protein